MICMAMRPRGRPCWHGGGTNTGAAAPAAAHHCHAHARTCMGFAGGPAGALDIESAQAAAGAIPRASAPRISESPPRAAGSSPRSFVGRGESPHAPHGADCGCQCSALQEIASAWPLPYAWNKLNWIFQFSFYEYNQDKGNN
jgi:hypothetical protein